MEPLQISKLRKRINVSQSEMAELIGAASGVVVSQYETGFRKPNGIVKRFFVLLSSLSNSDLQKTTKMLRKIHDEHTSK